MALRGMIPSVMLLWFLIIFWETIASPTPQIPVCLQSHLLLRMTTTCAGKLTIKVGFSLILLRLLQGLVNLVDGVQDVRLQFWCPTDRVGFQTWRKRSYGHIYELVRASTMYKFWEKQLQLSLYFVKGPNCRK